MGGFGRFWKKSKKCIFNILIYNNMNRQQKETKLGSPIIALIPTYPGFPNAWISVCGNDESSISARPFLFNQELSDVLSDMSHIVSHAAGGVYHKSHRHLENNTLDIVNYQC